jgi:hypothetical protein
MNHGVWLSVRVVLMALIAINAFCPNGSYKKLTGYL